MIRPINLVGAARPVDHVRVDRHRLPGGTARKHLRQRGVVGHRLDDLLNADQRNMHRGQRGRHAPLALVGHQTQRARFRDQEIAT